MGAMNCFEVGASARLPEIHFVDTWQRGQISEPFVVGDPNIEVHHEQSHHLKHSGLGVYCAFARPFLIERL